MEKFSGIHYISGFCEYKEYDEYENRDNEGYVIVFECGVLIALYDKNDGFRSYGLFRWATDNEIRKIKITNRFPQQKVKVNNEMLERMWEEGVRDEYLVVRNAEDDSIILKVGTDFTDSWYPCGCCEWYPQNLPINKNR